MVEAFPTSKQDAGAGARALLSKMIPRWGVPKKISSDDDTPAVKQVLKQVSEVMGLCIPLTAGDTEHGNNMLKNKL